MNGMSKKKKCYPLYTTGMNVVAKVRPLPGANTAPGRGGRGFGANFSEIVGATSLNKPVVR